MFDYPVGATSLDPDETAGLIPNHISTQAELNEWEQVNILQAHRWAFARKHSPVLQESFCRKLHKKMFDQTWRWAGQFRRSNKNIGVSWEQVSVHSRLLFEDTCYQLLNEVYGMDELAMRFHHRLVSIHLFPNGNGRHARMMADVLLFAQGEKPFTWGRKNLPDHANVRQQYIAALRQADKGNHEDLLEFVRS